MSAIKKARIRRFKRKKRVSMKIVGTSIRPRLSVYRSLKHLFVQAIDDDKKITIISITDMGKKNNVEGTKTQKAEKIGKELSQKLIKLGIKKLVFDRGQNRYLGRIKRLAESLRENGITI